jgi:hypothetical protein
LILRGRYLLDHNCSGPYSGLGRTGRRLGSFRFHLYLHILRLRRFLFRNFFRICGLRDNNLRSLHILRDRRFRLGGDIRLDRGFGLRFLFLLGNSLRLDDCFRLDFRFRLNHRLGFRLRLRLDDRFRLNHRFRFWLRLRLDDRLRLNHRLGFRLRLRL